MGSRKTGPGVENVYEAAATWVDRALKADDSLFTPGSPIWTKSNLGQIRERFLDRPDYGNGTFYEKLEQQLANSPPPVYQLMAEVLYAHFLIIWHQGMGGPRKRNQIEQVLDWGAPVHSLPQYLVDGLTPGIARSQTLNLHRPFHIAFIIEFAEQWKDLTENERVILQNDPWAFKGYLADLPFRSRILKDHPNTPGAQREALLHLVHPDYFEGTVSVQQKEEIAGAPAFAHFITENEDDVDQKLAQIRRRLEAELGRDFDFYDRDVGGVDIRARWDPASNPWDEFIRQAQRYVASGRLETDELDYKLEMADRLAAARAAVLADDSQWRELLRQALRARPGHPIAWQLVDDFHKWCSDFPQDARWALQMLWDGRNPSVAEPVRDFAEILPDSALRGSVGNRTNVISVLLMGLDAENYPPYRVRLFTEAYRRTGYPTPDRQADEADVYEHALGFLDRFIDEARERGVELRHRLDAQSVVWQIPGMDPEEKQPPPVAPTSPSSLEVLANQLYLTRDFLREIELMLLEKNR